MLKKALILAAFVGLMAAFAPKALAATPYLSVSGQSGDNYTFTITGADSNARVVLYARTQGSSLWSTVIDPIGYTDFSGNLTTTKNAGLGSSAGEFYVLVNGQQSGVVSSNYNNYNNYNGNYSGCTYNCGSPYGLSLSQNSVSVAVGQNSYVTAYNSSGLYISSNSNSSVVIASVSGNQITLYGRASGTATVQVCGNSYNNNYYYNNSSNCASIFVTVSGGVLGANTNLWFSPSNPTLFVGQNLAVSINSSVVAGSYYYPQSNAYYISSNSNSGVVSANVVGTVLNLYGLTNGSSTINVCHSSLGYCSSLYVTVSGGSSGSSITFSEPSPAMYVGQSKAVSIYGGSYGTYYIGANGNSSVVSASISGSTLNLYAMQNGSSTISICQYGGTCGYIYATVSGSGTGSLTLSQGTLNLTPNQSSSVTVYGNNSGLYISQNSNSQVASATLSGNTVNVYAYTQGNTTISICQTGYSVCAYLYVTVSGGSTGGQVWFSPSSANINVGQNQAVNIYSGSFNSYYISANSNPSVVTASISGNIMNIYGRVNGSSTVTVCQSSVSACSSFYVTVSGGGTTGGLSLSQTSVSLNIGQTSYVTAYNSSGLYISSNSNSSVASASVSGSQIMIYGLTNGSTNILVCSGGSGYTVGCATVYVTVSGGGGVLGTSIYKNGTLISENGTVYITYKNTKTGFANRAAFEGLGFRFTNVLSTGYTGLVNSGYIVQTAYASHPWGSWIKSGGTVYFVHESGLIPVPSYDVFLNNGGQDYLVVPANSWDFSLPMLSPMTYGDFRLQ